MSQTTPQVAIIADDLTGAMDVAGPFAARGHATCVVVTPDRCALRDVEGAAVVSINTDSRHLSGADAAARVHQTVRRLIPSGVHVLVKKIDSTLRGNVVAETLAMLDAAGRTDAVVAPAFPAQGRTVHLGVVHVLGVPLAQTPFARDALSPPPLEPLQEVFRHAAPAFTVENVAPTGEWSPMAVGARRVLIVDSQSDEDLAACVRRLAGRLGECVLVGSAGIAAAVAQESLALGASPPRPAVTGEILVAVGSRTQQSAEQVRALARLPGVVVCDAVNGRVCDSRAWREPARVRVVRASSGAAEARADQVAFELGKSVAHIVSCCEVEAVVVTGGDTAVAILRALDQPVVHVMGELLPGIPYGRIAVSGRPLWLVTKAGGFGTRETFVEIAERLRAAT